MYQNEIGEAQNLTILGHFTLLDEAYQTKEWRTFIFFSRTRVYVRHVTSHICPRRYVINLEKYVTKRLDDLSQIYFIVVHALNINRWLFALLFALI